MKLYRLTQTTIRGYDTFDSCIVVANSISEAKSMHPYDGGDINSTNRYIDDWPKHPEQITAEYIGKADPKFTQPEVLCASFNAG